jgi:beta-lactamase class A
MAIMDRREALAAMAAIALFSYKRRAPAADAAIPVKVRELAAIEARVVGRLGVAAIDTDSGRRLAYREHDRFPLCSTFKWLLVAHVLSRVDAHQEQLTRFVRYAPGDILDYAPITRAHVQDGGMSVEALAEAAIEYSDNTAANLLLSAVGGPSRLTAYLRHIEDPVTRLDRMEPELNSAVPGDPRDTTTPNAMVADMQAILLGSRLTGRSRDLLIGWLLRSTTGTERLRAGVPKDWRVGDKTGTGERGSTNDVAVMWPPGGRPILAAAYLTETTAGISDRNRALEEVGRVIAQWTIGLRTH